MKCEKIDMPLSCIRSGDNTGLADISCSRVVCAVKIPGFIAHTFNDINERQ